MAEACRGTETIGFVSRLGVLRCNDWEGGCRVNDGMNLLCQTVAEMCG